MVQSREGGMGGTRHERKEAGNADSAMRSHEGGRVYRGACAWHPCRYAPTLGLPASPGHEWQAPTRKARPGEIDNELQSRAATRFERGGAFASFTNLNVRSSTPEVCRRVIWSSLLAHFNTLATEAMLTPSVTDRSHLNVSKPSGRVCVW